MVRFLLANCWLVGRLNEGRPQAQPPGGVCALCLLTSDRFAHHAGLRRQRGIAIRHHVRWESAGGVKPPYIALASPYRSSGFGDGTYTVAPGRSQHHYDAISLSRCQLTPDFRLFYNDTMRAAHVYRPGPGAKLLETHVGLSAHGSVRMRWWESMPGVPWARLAALAVAA